MGVVHQVVDRGVVIGWMIFCTACGNGHLFYKDRWTFDGNMEKPTFSPSMLVYGHVLTGDEVPEYKPQKRCHTFVRNGMIEYLVDCEHEYASKTIPLEEF